MPHLRQSFRLGLHHSALQISPDDLRAVFELARFAIILLDSEQRVVCTNSAAEAMLKAGSPLRLRAGRVQAVSLGYRSQVASLVDAVLADMNPFLPVTDRTLQLPIADGHSLLLYVAPLATAYFRAGQPSGRAVLFIVDPQRVRTDRRQTLHRLYGLTAAEATLAELLCDGLALDKAAEQLGTRVSTMRTHLRNLLHKTRTKRQGQLIAVLEREFALFDLLAGPHED